MKHLGNDFVSNVIWWLSFLFRSNGTSIQINFEKDVTGKGRRLLFSPLSSSRRERLLAVAYIYWMLRMVLLFSPVITSDRLNGISAQRGPDIFVIIIANGIFSLLIFSNYSGLLEKFTKTFIHRHQFSTRVCVCAVQCLTLEAAWLHPPLALCAALTSKCQLMSAG